MSQRKTLILTQKLEGVSKKVLERYQKIIIQYIGSKPGYMLFMMKRNCIMLVEWLEFLVY